MKSSRVCILGGSGFVGRHLAARLTAKGIQCHIPVRNPQRHKGLKVLPGIRLFSADLFDPQALSPHLAGCDAVINLVGILNEGRNPRGFQRAHVELPAAVIEACRMAKTPRLLHMSALNANQDQGPSRYLFSKGEGENRAHRLGPPAVRVTSFRPSVIFGPGDSFFNRFGSLLQKTPAPFPLACPDARFAPVYVGDVAEAFLRALHDPASEGMRYELCGPRVFTLEELVRYTAAQLGLKRRIIRLSERASRLQAHLLGQLPGQPFSFDNYLSLQVNSVCQHNALPDLGITPTDMEDIVPRYLGTGRRQQRLSHWRQTTR